ncbi:hypothetical protein OUZ56_032012 [Daphnia magna]|uniref:Uncharacterized protein n=1 Tax=Daphnia magna TaxID=35525 RepID=A0ABQ9ZVV4_9CRUS|nr:hypothetical protein OUZ56_032012 [Daphnia magna]
MSIQGMCVISCVWWRALDYVTRQTFSFQVGRVILHRVEPLCHSEEMAHTLSSPDRFGNTSEERMTHSVRFGWQLAIHRDGAVPPSPSNARFDTRYANVFVQLSLQIFGWDIEQLRFFLCCTNDEDDFHVRSELCLIISTPLPIAPPRQCDTKGSTSMITAERDVLKR